MAEKSKKGLVIGIVVAAVLLVGCLGLVGLVGVGAAVFIPSFIEMQYKAKRAEVPGHVSGIKTAQVGYDAAFDEFVPCPDATPRELWMLDGNPYPWMGDDCWWDLGWAPDGDVRGTYWVEVSGYDFTVYGAIDADGDGVPAIYTATKSINPVLTTPDDVY